MARKENIDGASEDLAGLRSILEGVAERPSAEKTRKKIEAINSKANSSAAHNIVVPLSQKTSAQAERPSERPSRPVPAEERSPERPLTDTERVTTVDTQVDTQGDTQTRFIDNTTQKAHDKPSPLRRLTLNEILVFNWLSTNPNVHTQYQVIGEETGVSQASVRKIINRFTGFGWVKTQRGYKDRVQGIFIESNLPDASDLPLKERASVHASVHTSVHASAHPIPLDNRDRDNLSISNRSQSDILAKLTQIDESEFSDQFPHLAAINFTTDEIKRLVKHWATFDIVPHGIFQSLRHAEWAVEHKLTDKAGNQIGAGYIFNALKRNGAYDRPKGYESPIERAIKHEEEEKKLLEEQKIQQEETLFRKWMTDLDEDRKSQLISETSKRHPFMNGMSEERVLQHYWRNNVLCKNGDDATGATP